MLSAVVEGVVEARVYRRFWDTRCHGPVHLSCPCFFRSSCSANATSSPRRCRALAPPGRFVLCVVCCVLCVLHRLWRWDPAVPHGAVERVSESPRECCVVHFQVRTCKLSLLPAFRWGARYLCRQLFCTVAACPCMAQSMRAFE